MQQFSRSSRSGGGYMEMDSSGYAQTVQQRPQRRENGTPKDNRGRDEVATAAEKVLLEGEKERESCCRDYIEKDEG
ncbi:hypothetical protein WN944_026084 [Citrus x changshan-huyou]|uniref:Uncharacterized protein n=1 Tax=Citrus x changshan-huyou TaxID=2935761 RepID=A0AAP0LUG0_9ROSI